MIHAVQPGPLLFQTNPGMVYGIIATALLANILMVVFMLSGVPVFVGILRIAKAHLLPAVLM